MKSQYESRTRFSLPRRTYTIIRLDGKAFHTYTRGLEKPFDNALQEDMDNAIITMLPELQGAVFAYTQSDEISILLTDFALTTTDAWFDGNLQKMCSVASSIITAQFNHRRLIRHQKDAEKSLNLLRGIDVMAGVQRYPRHLAYFDARVFTIPDRTEVMNYFLWRNQDCSRNSISMVAQSLYSHKELHGKNTSEMHEMIHAKGKNWATDFTDGQKNGRLIVKEEYDAVVLDTLIGVKGGFVAETARRRRWVAKGASKFSENKDMLMSMIPKYE